MHVTRDRCFLTYDTGGAGSTLQLRWCKDGRMGPQFDPEPVCLWRMCQYRVAWCQPARFQLAAGSPGICTPLLYRCCSQSKGPQETASGSGLECCRHFRPEGNDPDYPKPEGAATGNERLRGHSKEQCAVAACHETH